MTLALLGMIASVELFEPKLQTSEHLDLFVYVMQIVEDDLHDCTDPASSGCGPGKES